MANRTRYTFWIDAPDLQAIQSIKEKEGVPESEQIRRALKEWLRKRGALKGGKGKK
jgi:hypothetical protein